MKIRSTRKEFNLEILIVKWHQRNFVNLLPKETNVKEECLVKIIKEREALLLRGWDSLRNKEDTLRSETRTKDCSLGV